MLTATMSDHLPDHITPKQRQCLSDAARGLRIAASNTAAKGNTTHDGAVQHHIGVVEHLVRIGLLREDGLRFAATELTALALMLPDR